MNVALRGLLRFTKWVALTVTTVVGLVVVMQLVPYGRAHANPPIVAEPAWDSPRTRELAKRACFDCHSNETRWPWYSNVAPMSWVLQNHVEIGRSVLNFSDWTQPYDLKEQAGSEVIRREMPPRTYRMIHADANLTHEENVELARGLHATFGLAWND